MAEDFSNLSAQDLVKKKDEIEQNIKELFQILDTNDHVGMDPSLIDREGFPRSDIDVYTVRQTRNKIICLRNDHKKLMTLIEDKLHELHTTAREKGTITSGRQRNTSTVKKPFATITTVTMGSPAAASGVQVDDRIVEFGSVTSENFSNIQDIGNVVQHSEGKSIRLVVLRDDTINALSIVPRRWSGRGLLGCTIVPVLCGTS